tara:strand:- start:204 stop:440 length:237 start_codon:yes stop_codon:yes gene_type:complete
MLDLDKLYDDMMADDKPLNDDDLIAEQLRAQPYIDIEAGIFSTTICNKANCSTVIDGDTNNNWCRHHLFTEEGIVGDP